MSRRAFEALLLSSLAACSAPGGAGPGRPSSVEPATVDAREAHSIQGTVRDAHGAAVPGAIVALVHEVDLRGEEPDSIITTSDAQGAYAFDEVAAGHFAITATAPGHLPGYGGAFDFAATDHKTIDVVVERGGKLFAGVVRDEKGPVVRQAVSAIELSPRELSTFATITDDAGHYELTLDPSLPYYAQIASPPRMRLMRSFDPHIDNQELVLEPGPAPRPSNEILTKYLEAHSWPVLTDDPGAALDDLEPIRKALGSARLIAIGEGTHGSHEIFRMRHRLFRSLVERGGATVFAMEAGYAECRAIDDYIHGGKGDVHTLIRGLVTDYVETDEWVELIDWMRAYNADTRHKKKLTFAGFDVTTSTAVKDVVAAVRKVSVERARGVEEALAPLASYDADGTFASEPPERRVRAASMIKTLQNELLSSPVDRVLEHELEILSQATEIFVNPLLRDRAMARNVDWLVEDSNGARIVLSMHDSHAMRHPMAQWDLGARLATKYPNDYLVIGTAFGRGGFRALGADMSKGAAEHVVDGPLPGTFESGLALAGPRMFAIDLRATEGAVGDWMNGSMSGWNIGFRFVDAPSATMPFIPKASYDIVIFLPQVTAAHAFTKR